jgi:uncharacterized membrane protein
MVSGVFISILFGVNEDLFKNKIQEGLSQNQKIMKISDEVVREEKIKQESSKNWRYYQRFHFHATAIGSMSIAILVLLSFIHAPAKFKVVTSWLIGLGGLLYPFVWLFAAIYGPIMGRSQAKEAFKIFAFGGGAYLVGLLILVFLLLKYPLEFKQNKI